MLQNPLRHGSLAMLILLQTLSIKVFGTILSILMHFNKLQLLL